jgi:CRP/FNR family transcriptional regulator
MASKQNQPEATAGITVDFLQSVPLFSNMSRTEIEQIKPYFFPREFRRKEIIFLKGDPCKELYIIASGQVKLSEISENGREQALFILSQGDSFDVVPIIDGGLYPTTATALNDVMLYVIIKQDVLTIMCEYPTVASAVLPHLGKNDIQGTPTPEGMLVKRTLTHQEIADIVGTEREVVTRSLSDLQKKGIIDMKEGKQILIRDKGKLHNK